MQDSTITINRPLVNAIDDSADYRSLLERIFSLYLPDYDLHLFEDGHSYLQTLHAIRQPGLILVDSQMPVVNGYEVVRQLRQHAQWRYTPIIVMNDTESADEVSESYAAGASSFLVKPTEQDSLRRVMQSVCYYWFELNRQSFD